MLYFLLAAIGVVLLLPTGTKKTGEETEQPQETAARPAGDAGLSVQEEMEQRLCDALSQMDGVGAVHVVVTLESTGKKIVEKDVPTRSTTEENKKGEETGTVCGFRGVPGGARRARHRIRRGKPGDDTGDSGGRDGIISGGRK